eukprot:GHVT01013708.1.p1 GENE.GHVT01013708.1~~GHVT01013708.1.p1  ORF type:complete len:1399 (+),score=183.33 GHVT01013708.1:213-4199(+)
MRPQSPDEEYGVTSALNLDSLKHLVSEVLSSNIPSEWVELLHEEGNELYKHLVKWKRGSTTLEDIRAAVKETLIEKAWTDISDEELNLNDSFDTVLEQGDESDNEEDDTPTKKPTFVDRFCNFYGLKDDNSVSMIQTEKELGHALDYLVANPQIDKEAFKKQMVSIKNIEALKTALRGTYVDWHNEHNPDAQCTNSNELEVSYTVNHKTNVVEIQIINKETNDKTEHKIPLHCEDLNDVYRIVIQQTLHYHDLVLIPESGDYRVYYGYNMLKTPVVLSPKQLMALTDGKFNDNMYVLESKQLLTFVNGLKSVQGVPNQNYCVVKPFSDEYVADTEEAKTLEQKALTLAVLRQRANAFFKGTHKLLEEDELRKYVPIKTCPFESLLSDPQLTTKNLHKLLDNDFLINLLPIFEKLEKGESLQVLDDGTNLVYSDGKNAIKLCWENDFNLVLGFVEATRQFLPKTDQPAEMGSTGSSEESRLRESEEDAVAPTQAELFSKFWRKDGKLNFYSYETGKTTVSTLANEVYFQKAELTVEAKSEYRSFMQEKKIELLPTEDDKSISIVHVASSTCELRAPVQEPVAFHENMIDARSPEKIFGVTEPVFENEKNIDNFFRLLDRLGLVVNDEPQIGEGCRFVTMRHKDNLDFVIRVRVNDVELNESFQVMLTFVIQNILNKNYKEGSFEICTNQEGDIAFPTMLEIYNGAISALWAEKESGKGPYVSYTEFEHLMELNADVMSDVLKKSANEFIKTQKSIRSREQETVPSTLKIPENGPNAPASSEKEEESTSPTGSKSEVSKYEQSSNYVVQIHEWLKNYMEKTRGKFQNGKVHIDKKNDYLVLEDKTGRYFSIFPQNTLFNTEELEIAPPVQRNNRINRDRTSEKEQFEDIHEMLKQLKEEQEAEKEEARALESKMMNRGSAGSRTDLPYLSGGFSPLMPNYFGLQDKISTHGANAFSNGHLSGSTQVSGGEGSFPCDAQGKSINDSENSPPIMWIEPLSENQDRASNSRQSVPHTSAADLTSNPQNYNKKIVDGSQLLDDQNPKPKEKKVYMVGNAMQVVPAEPFPANDSDSDGEGNREPDMTVVEAAVETIAASNDQGDPSQTVEPIEPTGAAVTNGAQDSVNDGGQLNNSGSSQGILTEKPDTSNGVEDDSQNDNHIPQGTTQEIDVVITDDDAVGGNDPKNGAEVFEHTASGEPNGDKTQATAPKSAADGSDGQSSGYPLAAQMSKMAPSAVGEGDALGPKTVCSSLNENGKAEAKKPKSVLPKLAAVTVLTVGGIFAANKVLKYVAKKRRATPKTYLQDSKQGKDKDSGSDPQSSSVDAVFSNSPLH